MRVSESHDFRHGPDVIRDPRFHGLGHSKGLVNATEVVPHEMKCNGGFQVFNFL